MKFYFRYSIPAAAPAEMVMRTDFLTRPAVPPFHFLDDSSLAARPAVQILRLNRFFPLCERHAGKVSNSPNLGDFARDDSAQHTHHEQRVVTNEALIVQTSVVRKSATQIVDI